jgi:hypothetical protein
VTRCSRFSDAEHSPLKRRVVRPIRFWDLYEVKRKEAPVRCGSETRSDPGVRISFSDLINRFTFHEIAGCERVLIRAPVSNYRSVQAFLR